MPDGLTLASDGTLNENPSETGVSNIEVSVLDGQGNSGQRTYSIKIATIASIVISPETLEDGTYGIDYIATLTACGGDSGYVFTLDQGALPKGLDLSQSGEISGSPKNTGTFGFKILVTDVQGNTGSREYTLVIASQSDLLEITPDDLPVGTFGDFYSVVLTTSGGTGPYYVEIIEMEKSLDLYSKGESEFNGTPLRTGNFPMTAVAIDAEGNTGT